MNKIGNIIIGTYLKVPILIDLVLIAIVDYLLYLSKESNVVTELLTGDNLRDFYGDLISTSIALAGFIVAALTIIITFKDNLSTKGNESALSTVLNDSRLYSSIVRIFYFASFVFFSVFGVLTLLKLFFKSVDSFYLLMIAIASLILMIMAIVRSLLILFRIIKIQAK